MPIRDLTAKQHAFVQEYLVDLNSTRAAIRAGYSARNADKIGPALIGKSRVAHAIRLARVARSERVQITQDDVIAGLHHEATLAGEGSSHAARVSAWGLLGRHLGMMGDKSAVAVNVNVNTTQAAEVRAMLIARLQALAIPQPLPADEFDVRGGERREMTDRTTPARGRYAPY